MLFFKFCRPIFHLFKYWLQCQSILCQTVFNCYRDCIKCLSSYNVYESDVPPINLNNLREPTLFILNDEALKILKFSELNIGREKVQSVTIIQDPIEIKELGYSRFNSLVKIRTEGNKN